MKKCGMAQYSYYPMKLNCFLGKRTTCGTMNPWNCSSLELIHTYKQCLQSLAQPVNNQFSHHVCGTLAVNIHSLMSTYPNDQPVQNIISYSEFVAGICAAYIFLLKKKHSWRNWRRWQIGSMKECCMEKTFGRFETKRMSWLQKFCQNDTYQFWNVATNSWLQNIMNRYKVLSCKSCVHLINCYAYILTSPRRYLYFIEVVGIVWSNDPEKERYPGPPRRGVEAWG